MEDKRFELRAELVTVEVSDPQTGEIFRRELPIEYYENANFLRLRGENFDGSLSELVFYTPRGIQKLKDVSGSGADKATVTDSPSLSAKPKAKQNSVKKYNYKNYEEVYE